MKTTETRTVTITTTTWDNGIKYADIQEQIDILRDGGITTRLMPLDTDRFIDWLNEFKLIK